MTSFFNYLERSFTERKKAPSGKNSPTVKICKFTFFKVGKIILIIFITFHEFEISNDLKFVND